MNKRDEDTRVIYAGPTQPPRMPAVTAKQLAPIVELRANSCHIIGFDRVINIINPKGFEVISSHIRRYTWEELRVKFPNIHWEQVGNSPSPGAYLEMSLATFSYPRGKLELRIFSEPFDNGRTVRFAHLYEPMSQKTLCVLYTMIDFFDLDPKELVDK